MTISGVFVCFQVCSMLPRKGEIKLQKLALLIITCFFSLFSVSTKLLNDNNYPLQWNSALFLSPTSSLKWIKVSFMLKPVSLKGSRKHGISRWFVSPPLHGKRRERNYKRQLWLHLFALSPPHPPFPIPKTKNTFCFPVLRAHFSSGLSSKSLSGSLRNEGLHHRGAAVTLPLSTPAQTHLPHHRSRSAKNRITDSSQLLWHYQDHIVN